MMNRYFKICLLLPAIALGACGKMGDLEPRLASKPIPAAYGSDKPATPGELVTASAQARPGRSVELLRRSDRREDDPFDLPPGKEPAPSDDGGKSAGETPIPSPRIP